MLEVGSDDLQLFEPGETVEGQTLGEDEYALVIGGLFAACVLVGSLEELAEFTGQANNLIRQRMNNRSPRLTVVRDEEPS